MRIGVLALQGDFAEHEQALTRIGLEPVRVRLAQHLEGLDGLIIPGGESTAIGGLMEQWGLLEPIRLFSRPVWGTCAGAILMARALSDSLPSQPVLGLIDMRVRRNAYGRQVDSFEADLSVPSLGEKVFRAVFIRAPTIEHVGASVQVLARLKDELPVAVCQGAMLATTFHPELTEDDRFHRYFADLCDAAHTTAS